MADFQKKVTPRWEWRTFASSLRPLEQELQSLVEVAPRDSSEIYVLNLEGLENAKIRRGLLEVKRLRQIDWNGLELWDPAFKAGFPLTRNDIATAFLKWSLPPPTLVHDGYSFDEFLALIARHPKLRVVNVDTSRRGFVFQNCIAEFVELSAELQSLQSFSLEHECAEPILAALKQLGIDSHSNVNYPLGLKRALELQVSAHIGVTGRRTASGRAAVST